MVGVACADEAEETPDVAQTPDGSEETIDNNESPSSEGPKVPQADLDILNYALTLEYLEAEFYKQGLSGNLLSGREREIVDAVGAHEDAHVAALTQTIEDLGGKPVAKPKFKIPPATFKDKAKFLQTAVTFEELGVTAYHGQVPEVQTPDILGAAAAIAGVESRHAAVLTRMVGGKPFPAPFEKSASMDEVLKAVQPFLAS
jgi:rubrerythrin